MIRQVLRQLPSSAGSIVDSRDALLLQALEPHVLEAFTAEVFSEAPLKDSEPAPLARPSFE